MTYEIVILGLAIHALIWEHLPHWGEWFNNLIKALPKPLQTLYDYWNCPFCAGFWIALSLHAATGQWTFPMLGELPAYWAGAALPLGWFLDALGTAILIKFAAMAMHALGLPAMKAHSMKAEFMESLKSERAA